jgi:quercetin dioxygenase-like cupin family protein
VVRILGPLAAITAWLGWLGVCPALGFPSLGTAAMFNRVLVPKDDPGSWLGWALLLIGLAAAALLYLAAVDRGRLRPSLTSGVVYGVICWLVAGAVIMPLLGLVDPIPAPSSAVVNAPDPMHGSFMMLHIGIAAPIAALVAWLLFGAVLGATAGPRSTDPAVGLRWTLREPALGAAIATVLLLTIVLVGPRLVGVPTSASVTAVRTVATEPAQALPKGPDFFSVLELAQAPGAQFGPHSHLFSGFAYGLKGVATITFEGSGALQIAPASAGFIAIQAVHSHNNNDDRIPTVVIALLILALVVAVVLIALRPGQREARFLPVALVLLIAAGAIGTWNPWQNDWLFFSVRAIGGRGAAMPLPTASRAFESANIDAATGGSYVQTLEEITIAPGEAAPDAGSAGAALLFVLDGRVDVAPTGAAAIQLGARGATLLQPGTSARISNAGDRPAHLIRFSVTPAPQS